MKSSASESVRNAYFNLGWLSRSSRLAWLGIVTVERPWSSFYSDAKLFMYGTYMYGINYNKVFCKQFDQNEHFSPFELSSASESIQAVQIVWVRLNS